MIAFELRKNGKRVQTAGIAAPADLSAILSWVDRRPRPPRGMRATEMSISVGGSDLGLAAWEPEMGVHWKSTAVKVGDTLELRIVEVEKVDRPAQKPRFAGTDATEEQKLLHALAVYQRQARRSARAMAQFKKQQRRSK